MTKTTIDALLARISDLTDNLNSLTVGDGPDARGKLIDALHLTRVTLRIDRCYTGCACTKRESLVAEYRRLFKIERPLVDRNLRIKRNLIAARTASDNTNAALAALATFDGEVA